MRKLFFTVLISISALAYSQIVNTLKIDSITLENVQFELQKQADLQKQLIIELENLKENVASLSNVNKNIEDSICILKSNISDSNIKLSQKIEKSTAKLSNENKRLSKSISATKKELQDSIICFQKELEIKLTNQYNTFENIQKADKDTICKELSKTNKSVVNTQDELSNQSSTGIIITAVLITVIVMTVFLLSKKIKKGNNNIDDLKRVQASLQKAQIGIQEESLKLDNKLLEIVEKQMALTPIKKEENEIDHSLALKVADEIVRIETNLSRMDANIRGHKQLSKAVERIKNNFYANGYEIVDMLGKGYAHGMKAAVTFITDETLKEGERIITKIIKPQINYKGEMIQAAQIEVSQAE